MYEGKLENVNRRLQNIPSISMHNQGKANVGLDSSIHCPFWVFNRLAQSKAK